MEMLWVLLSIGLACSEKLHRKYLPPSGSAFSGGSSGDIDIPLEVTDNTYAKKDEKITIIPEAIIGIERGTHLPADTFVEMYNNINNNLTQYNHTLTVSHFSQITPISTNTEKFPLIVPSVQTLKKIQRKADREASILNYEQSISPTGYTYSYDTSNGIHGEAEGIATNGVKVKGSYSYIGDDGNLYQVEYTADENGFVPKGDHLPTAPPIPDAILKVIEIAAKNKEAGIYDDGSYDDNKYGYKNYLSGYLKMHNDISAYNFLPGDENKNLYDEDDRSIESSEDGLSDVNFERNNVNVHQTDINGIIFNTIYQDYYSQPNLDISISNKSSKMSLIKGNEYFSPQSPKFNLFPSRYSGNDQDKVISENKTDMVTTPIPFLTPYVSRIDDDELETSDVDKNHDDNDIDYDEDSENPHENLANDGNGSIQFKKLEYPGSKDEELMNAPQYGERISNNNELVPSDEKDGYVYKNGNQPFIFSRISNTTSTAVPTEFTTRISMLPNENIAGKSLSSLITPTFPNKSLFDISTNSSNYPLPAQTVSVVDTDSTTKSPGLVLSSKSVQTITPGGKFSTSNRAIIKNSSYPIIYNVQTSTEIIIGEDFNRPEQPQRFDPITGYLY